ncbi:Pentatricopeptide repeat-containing protein [Abeliophyllum distichum]|uniref:Pentatricopeptide repeat-containing protein n=1 Tax=Abeliophyllum distichum TaxID=126358 RepID=A0ABD1R935_9LAMI
MRYQIAKLVKDGLYKEAIALYTKLHSASLPPTKFTFPYLLKACAKLNGVSHGQMLHAHLIKTGHQTNIHTATDLTNMYMKFQLLDDAIKLFDEIPDPNIGSVNVVISGFLHNGDCEEAFKIFKVISIGNVRCDSVTIATVLSVCGDVVNGVQVHCLAIKIGVEMDVYSASSLLTMYFTCGDLASATRLFGLIGDKNLVCYNAYLSGLLQNGVLGVVLDVFNELRECLDEKANSVTLISVLSACANVKYIKFGTQLHCLIVKAGLDFDSKVGTALVDMYAKCGSWHCAYDFFKEMSCRRTLVTWNSMIAGMMLNEQIEIAIELFVQLDSEEFRPDSVTWNSMISGFSQSGMADEAIIFFRKMVSSGVTPSMKCITSLLPACSALSALTYGKEIHAYVVRNETNSNEFVATAVIDMYMKCGQPLRAHHFFNQFIIKPNDPAFWNAMISGYGRNGESEAAFEIFNQMIKNKVEPNFVTFNCILSMCSHTGQIDGGWKMFRLMTEEYGLNPTAEQINIMIDLLGRSGRLDEACELLQGISKRSASVFASLLAACKYHSDSKLGEEMAKKLSELEPENAIPFVILSNIYAGQEKWKDVEKIRTIMENKGLKKLPGFSLTGVT